MTEALDSKPQKPLVSADHRIASAVRALAAGRGVRNAELAPIVGVSRASMFAKAKGDSPWKAEEIEAVADYFDVSVADLFNGLGLFGNDEAPAASATGASDRVRHQGLEPRTR
ncbi:helix-turn-helix domain-containing protein [Brachybacterium huguangmaarense]